MARDVMRTFLRWMVFADGGAGVLMPVFGMYGNDVCTRWQLFWQATRSRPWTTVFGLYFVCLA